MSYLATVVVQIAISRRDPRDGHGQDDNDAQAKTPCQQCPLRELPHFREFNREELSFVAEFKKGELVVDAGATIFLEGAHSAHLFHDAFRLGLSL